MFLGSIHQAEPFLFIGNQFPMKEQKSAGIHHLLWIPALSLSFKEVGVTGFEPAVSTTRMLRDTKLRYTPTAKL